MNALTKNLSKWAFVALVLSPLTVAHAKMVNLGIKGGMNLSKVSTTSGGVTTSTDNKIGYGGGLSMDIGLAPMVSILVDVLYMQRRAGVGSYSYKYNMLHIPVQARLSFGMMMLTLGGYYALGLGNVKDTLGQEFKYSDLNNSTSDYGLTGGLGVRIPVGMGRFTLEARYNFGLRDLNDPSTTGTTSKWRSIDILAGILF